MQRRGWTLLFHDGVVEQLGRLHRAAERAERVDPKGFERNANVKLFQALSHLMVEAIPSDPARDEYRLGNTMGPAYRHWRRAKIGRRFRLYFRYDSKAKVIVYACKGLGSGLHKCINMHAAHLGVLRNHVGGSSSAFRRGTMTRRRSSGDE